MKKFWFLTILTGILVATAAALPACGSRYRTADLSISAEAVRAQLVALQSQAQNCPGNSNVASVSDITSFLQILQDPNASLYYAEAPGSMGSVSFVAPMDYSFLNSDQNSITPQKVYAYFVVRPGGNGHNGALILAGNGGSNPGAQACVAGNGAGAGGAGGAAPSPTPGVTDSSNISVDFAFALHNDGQTSMPGTSNMLTAGVLDNDGFQMDVAASNGKGSILTLRTEDITDSGDDLASVIQLRVYTVDPTTGAEGYIGQVNLAQPK